MNAIKNFINDEAGITAIEYALLASAIAVAIAAAATALSGKLTTVFTAITAAIK